MLEFVMVFVLWILTSNTANGFTPCCLSPANALSIPSKWCLVRNRPVTLRESHRSPKRKRKLRLELELKPQSEEEETDVYNDDAFGLVSLTSLFVTQDYVFCGVFVAYSFGAVLWKRRPKRDWDPNPGVVAVVSLATTVVLDFWFQTWLDHSYSLGWSQLQQQQQGGGSFNLAHLTLHQRIEVLVCALSFLLGTFGQRQRQRERT